MISENITPGRPYPYGTAVREEGIQFSIPYSGDSRIVLKIYDKGGKTLYSINMNDYRVLGSVHSVCIRGLKAEDISYNYVIDGETVRDPYVTRIRSRHKWGDFKRQGRGDVCLIYDPFYDWEGDRPLKLPFNEIICYMLHVRGFTKHVSSQVKGRGTFMGIIEKIPYLKELGITQVELMPAYDFDECETVTSYKSSLTDEDGNATGKEHRLNYWGFKSGSYFLPKPQYAYTDDSTTEFKDMVKALHKAGIEVIMQFYFPSDINRNMINDCLRFWQGEYHIDGFHIYGSHLPLDLLATDPLLTDTKLYYERYDKEGLFVSPKCCRNTFLAEFNQDYSVDVRRFLKSDEDMLHKYLFRQRCNPDMIKVINHLTSYDGFTLNDLVSYDYKHNEDNGEDNKDGTGYNYSWNCGTEGFTRKNAILKLRMKQLKNAFCLLMFSQGTPMFMAGDEFMNTQNGNNNPYCQDNEITWLNWKHNKRNTELFEYVKMLIALRRSHPVLHMPKEATLLDGKSCGYPDISYHSENAWYPQMETHIRYIGTMLCGNYAADGKDDFFYIATNMHWEEHVFALPKLPKEMEWKYCLDTAGGSQEAYPLEIDENGNKRIRVPARTIVIMISGKHKKSRKAGRV